MALAMEERKGKTPETKRKEKAARARARAASKKAESRKTQGKRIRKLERAIQDRYKPLEEWDLEELARGRPRTEAGDFRGPAPSWLPRAVHEEAIKRFTEMARADSRALVPLALNTVRMLLTSEDTDDNGKPLVPASVKFQASSWVVEHLIGKPTQRTEVDISVRLQGILGAAMAVPGEQGELMPATDIVDAELVEEE